MQMKLINSLISLAQIQESCRHVESLSADLIMSKYCINKRQVFHFCHLVLSNYKLKKYGSLPALFPRVYFGCKSSPFTFHVLFFLTLSPSRFLIVGQMRTFWLRIICFHFDSWIKHTAVLGMKPNKETDKVKDTAADLGNLDETVSV